MPLSIEVCLCILLCMAGMLFGMLGIYFMERALLYQARREDEIQIRNKEKSASSKADNSYKAK